MNSRSDRKLSTDELKALNAKDLTKASECETRVTLTEKNWSAVVSLLERLCSMLDMILVTLATLLTKPDAEELRRRIEAEETAQNLGTLIGIAAGVALGIADKRKEAEQTQQPMQQSM